MMAGRISRCIIAAFAVLILESCDYGHKQYRPSDHGSSVSSPLLVVEVDDFGRFWDRPAAEQTLQTIEDHTLNTNTIVVVFIHGWNHNADRDDENFAHCEHYLDKLRKKLNEHEYAAARKKLNLQDGINVVGLYVGWRGRSLPGFLNYLTFWGRKSAAERVGEGDLREFLLRLQQVYMKRNRNDSPGNSTFMGMVTIGHSFGGQVLFKAISETFENDLINAIVRARPKLDKELPEIISGLGDMTVLINPALEAFQYERIDRLTKDTPFNTHQAPVLLTVSAENDRARQIWFPLGRNVNLPFRPPFQTSEVKQLWVKALGEYEPQRTHTLNVTQQPDTITDDLYTECQIATAPFTGSLVVAGAHLEARRQPAQPHSPVVVAYTSSDLVEGHNEIFKENFTNFVTDYVAYIEGKRMCLIRGQPVVQKH
jgi:hypothetical protein